MFKRGLYALSADPVHLGHLDIIRQASEVCETLVVYVTNNDEKIGMYLFSLNARRRLIKGALQGWLPRTEVVAGNEILTDMFIKEGCDVIIRGVRTAADMEYEKKQLAFHDLVLPGFAEKALLLQATPNLAHVSSTLVKAFALHHIDTSNMVPLGVKVALESALHEQVVVGITGGMAMGKSYVAEEIRKGLTRKSRPCTVVNFDALARALYAEDSPGAQILRDDIDRMLPGVLAPDRKSVDLGKMKAEISKADPEVIRTLHGLARPHIFRLFRDAVRGKKGLILVEWAQLAEDGMLPLVNNRVIVVDSPDRDAMLANRGVPKEFFEKFAARQWPTDKKVATIEQEIAQSGHGRLFQYTNRLGQPFDESILDQLLELVPVKPS